MKKQWRIVGSIIVILIFDSLSGVEIANANHPRGGLDNGEKAPDFSLPDTNNRIVTLSDHEGSENVVLVFYRGKF